MALSRVSVPVDRVTDIIIAGATGPLAARLYDPIGSGGALAPGLVFFHGGGLVAGDLDTHDGLCRRLATASGVRLIAVDYRLAPEHPFPAAVEDAEAATRAVIAGAPGLGIDPQRLGIGGDSAGATLATVAAAAVPGALRLQLLLCPVLDLVERRPSRVAYGDGYLLDQAIMDRDLADYCPPGQDPGDPRISPLRRVRFAGQPPALIHTAEYDPLRDEGEAYAAALGAAGVPVRLIDHPGMVHHFLGLEGLLPQARSALSAIGDQVRAALADQGTSEG